MTDRGRGRRRGRGEDRGGGPGGGAPPSSPSRGGIGRGGPPSVSSAGTSPSRGGARKGAPPSVSSAGTGSTGGRGGWGDRGRGRGGPAGGIVAAPAPVGSAVSIAASVQAVGVKKPGYGILGVPVDVIVNCFRAEVPKNRIYHYDITILPEDKVLPPKATMEIIHKMQEQNPTIFTKRGSYDGRKNLYSPIKYTFGNHAQFHVNDGTGRNPQRVRILFAAAIDPSSTARYMEGQVSFDENILTTLNACNVAIRMQPIQDHPFNARSFFTRAEARDMGRSVELRRGYFQSVRHAIGRMMVNVDISSAAFYKSGPLIGLCMEYLGKSSEADPLHFLSANQLEVQTRIDLARFVRNLSVRTTGKRVGAIKDISKEEADTLTFPSGDGSTRSVHAWFRRATGRPLRYPGLVCVQLSKTTWVPLECCDVVPGQFYHKQLTPAQVQTMTEFSVIRPDARLQSIRNGLQALGYGNSAWLQDLGINVDPNPISIQGRILPAPILMYGKNLIVQPRDGRRNMRDKTLYKPEKIAGCAIVIYDQRFGSDPEQHLKRSLFNTTRDLGIQGMPLDPPVLRKSATGGEYWKHFQEVAMLHKAVKGGMPNLIIAVLPDFGWEDIHIRIKNAGDIKLGVATQCLKSSKCGNGNVQYYANICLKINVKLGGINVILKPGTVPLLGNRATPTLVIGADVHHPGPGSVNQPSHAAVVASVDSDASKYIAISRVQPWRMEMINDLTDMIVHVIRKYMQYRKDVEKNADLAPQHILFYRAGISEGQFAGCKDFEVPQIIRACDRIGIPRPKLTLIVVGKRHHIRFFPPPGGRSDKSGNAPPGLVVDRGITSPVEYDFYLQSHAGSQGTNRSAHYNVLVDQNNLTPDDLQSISFALCHVYARSTCSISIVPPVYYARIVCERLKHHYDPDSDSLRSHVSNPEPQNYHEAADAKYMAYKHAFQPVHGHIAQHMYFQ